MYNIGTDLSCLVLVPCNILSCVSVYYNSNHELWDAEEVTPMLGNCLTNSNVASLCRPFIQKIPKYTAHVIQCK